MLQCYRQITSHNTIVPVLIGKKTLYIHIYIYIFFFTSDCIFYVSAEIIVHACNLGFNWVITSYLWLLDVIVSSPSFGRKILIDKLLQVEVGEQGRLDHSPNWLLRHARHKVTHSGGRGHERHRPLEHLLEKPSAVAQRFDAEASDLEVDVLELHTLAKVQGLGSDDADLDVVDAEGELAGEPVPVPQDGFVLR